MKVFGVPSEDLSRIVSVVSATLYNGNLVFVHRSTVLSSVLRCTFNLEVKDSSKFGPGAQASSSLLPGDGPRGRQRTSRACWHAYHDVLSAMFVEFPRARVDSLKAKYTAANFSSVSSANAVTDQCECEWEWEAYR